MSELPLAVVCASVVDGGDPVSFTTRQGSRLAVVKGTVAQLGDGSIVRRAPGQRVSLPCTASFEILLEFHRADGGGELADALGKAQRAAFAAWLAKHAQLVGLDLFAAKTTPIGSSALVRASKAHALKLLRMSGHMGVFTRLLRLHEHRLEPCSVVWSSLSLEDTLRQCRLHDRALGVVRNSRGFGIRTWDDGLEALTALLKSQQSTPLGRRNWQLHGAQRTSLRTSVGDAC